MNPRRAGGDRNTHAGDISRQRLYDRRNNGQPPLTQAPQEIHAGAKSKQRKISDIQNGVGKQQVDPAINATDKDHAKRSMLRQQRAQEGK